MINHGDHSQDVTLVFPFTTHDANGAAAAPSDAFEASDIKIVKDGTTVKTTTNGVTMTSPVASVVGVHEARVDTSNDTGDVGYWAAGSDYMVILDPDTETVATQSVVAVLGIFSIEKRLPRVDAEQIEGSDPSTLIQSAASAALVALHLDRLLAADYDPASPPGVATALLNELIENDAGVARFTANALEQAPAGGGGGDATEANQNTIITHLTDIKGATWDATNSLEAIHDDLEIVDAEVALIDAIVDATKVDTAAILLDTSTDGVVVSGTVDANVVQISGDATAADNLEATLETMLQGTVSGAGSTTSTVDTGATGHGDDTFIGRTFLFRTGALTRESGTITDYDSASGTFTFAADTWTAGAADGDAWVIV